MIQQIEQEGCHSNSPKRGISSQEKDDTTALEHSTNEDRAEAAVFLSGVNTASVSPLHNAGNIIDRSVSFSKRENLNNAQHEIVRMDLFP